MGKIYVEKFFEFSKRGLNSIIIFPDVPFWIAVSEVGKKLLEIIKETGDIDLSANLLSISKNDIQAFVDPLIKSGVITSSLKKREDLHFKDTKVIKPNKVTFLQTMKCNLKCKHCCVSDLSDEQMKGMSFEKAKYILRQVKELMNENDKWLTFLGGEPLCGDKFKQLIQYAVDIGFKVGLSTNGILVDEEFAKIAKENNINVQISIDGVDKESHEEVRGNGTWEKTITAIKLLNSYGVDIQTNMVYHKGNFERIEEYFDFAIQNGIKKVRLISLMNMGRAVNNMEMVPLSRFVNYMEQLIDRRKDIVELLDETSFMGLVLTAKFSQKVVSCGAGVITLTVAPDGNVYPCLNLYNEKFKMCNLFDKDFSQQFFSSKILKKFREMDISTLNDECAICNLKYFCGGKCRGETFNETGSELNPYPHCDEWKKAMEKVFWIIVDNPKLGDKKYLSVKKKTGEYLGLWH